MIDAVTREYDRARTQLNEQIGENARLRACLATQDAAVPVHQHHVPKPWKPPVPHGLMLPGIETRKFGGGTSLPEPGAPESPRPPPWEEDGSPSVEISPREEDDSLTSPTQHGAHRIKIVSEAFEGHDGDDRENGDRGSFGERSSFGEGERGTFQSVMTLDTQYTTDGPMGHCHSEDLEGEVEQLELLPIWAKRHRRGSILGNRRADDTLLMTNASRRLAVRAKATGMERLILKPSGRVAITWDVVTITMLTWDLIFVPLQAYELPKSDLWGTMELSATFVWTADLFLSFFKGYEDRGDTVMNPRQVVKHYLRTWFMFDFSIISMDWILLFAKSGSLVDWLRFSRFRRAVRLLRLMRLIKHGQRFLAVTNLVQSEDLLVIFRIFWLIVIMVAINHFISCAWYAVGMSGVHNESWAKKAFEEIGRDVTFQYRYCTSFHWSVTQFTPASMEVVPRNSIERIFNIIVIFIGMLMFSSFVSNMTNSMTYLTKRNYEKRQQREVMLSYMASKGLSLELRSDIAIFHGRQGIGRKTIILERDVASLKGLPENLLERLHIEVHEGTLVNHALFQHLLEEEYYVVHKLCHHAMSERAVFAGEELFRFGLRCSRMYFVVGGQGQYALGYGDGSVSEVLPRQWISEACLWVTWDHRGRMHTNSMCEFAALDAAEFQAWATRSRLMSGLQRYAKYYVRHAEREGAISDLWGQRLRVMDLVQKAFRPEEADVENPASKIMSLWCDTDYSTEKIFATWRTWAKQERALRKGGLSTRVKRGLLWSQEKLRKLAPRL